MRTHTQNTTPWGESQSWKRVAEGIAAVTTAGHGGLFLSVERWAELKKAMPKFRSFAGEQWLEEDCDACAAVILWPAEFEPIAVWSCVRSVRGGGPFGESAMGEWLASPAGAHTRGLAARWEADNAKNWIQGGGGTGPRGGWVSHWTRIGADVNGLRPRITIWTQDIPREHVVTGAELDALNSMKQAVGV